MWKLWQRRRPPTKNRPVEGTETEKRKTKIDGKEKRWGWRCRWIGRRSGEGGWYDIMASSLPPSLLSCLPLSLEYLQEAAQTTCHHTHTPTHTFQAGGRKQLRIFTQVLDWSTVSRYFTWVFSFYPTYSIKCWPVLWLWFSVAIFF